MRIRVTALVWLIALGFVSKPSFASGQWPREQVGAFHLRKALSPAKARTLADQAASTIKLPVSPGYDQGGSSLCWVYATMNVLESNYLAANPETAIALSRSAMQLLNMEDRYQREIRGIENNVYEGGTPVNAIGIMRNEEGWLRNPGLFAFADYHPDPTGASATDPLSFTPTGNQEQDIATVDQGLDSLYGALPATTHDLSGSALSPEAFAGEVIGTVTWDAYAPASANQPAGVGPHFDPDARKGTTATYLSVDQFHALFLKEFQSGHATTVDWGGHEEELYGADFDASGEPTQFYIKGSYGPDYEYTMDATDAFNTMVGISTTTLAGF